MRATIKMISKIMTRMNGLNENFATVRRAYFKNPNFKKPARNGERRMMNWNNMAPKTSAPISWACADLGRIKTRRIGKTAMEYLVGKIFILALLGWETIV
jgi:hypothetical protein